MKKIVLFIILSFVLFCLVGLFFFNNGETEYFINEKSNLNKFDSTTNSSSKLTVNMFKKVEEVEEFLELVDFWQTHFHLNRIEIDFNSLMSVSDLITIYRPQAEQGDPTAKYLISTLVKSCMSIDTSFEHTERHVQSVTDPNTYTFIMNSIERCEGVVNSLSKNEKQDMKKTGFVEDFFDLMLPNDSIDLDDLATFPISEKKQLLYEQFNTGITGVSKNPINHDVAILFEAFSKVDNPVRLQAVYTFLANLNLDGYEPFNEEVTSWLLATCASGYECNNFSVHGGGLTANCSYRNADCSVRTPEALVTNLAPNANYEDILKRAWQISQRIANGEQEQLILELLSKLSPENAKIFASLQTSKN